MAPAFEASPKVDPLIGAPVGAFIIDRFIAQGGMGRVYTARHHIVDTHRAAVKVLVDTANVADRAAFEKEARAAAGVKSINIVTLLDFGLLDDRSPYLVFELLAGETLEAQIKRRRTIPFTEALGLTQQVLSALSVIHNAGLVHRDIKPANLFLVNDPSNEVVVKVMDLGLAAARPQKYHETGVGTEKELNRAGTPVYASPEQFGELTVGPASDIYSLGVVLYEMVTGEVPFAERPGESESALPRRHTKEKPKQPRGLVDGLPLGVESLMLSMLEKDPRQRPTVIAARNEIIRLREQNRDQVREGPTQIRANPLAPSTGHTDQLPRLSTEETMVGMANLRRDNRAWLVGAVLLLLALVGVAFAVRQSADGQMKPEGTVAVATAPPAVAPASDKNGPLVAPPVKTTPGDELTALPSLPSSPAPPIESVKKSAGVRPSRAVAAQPAVMVTALAPEGCDLDSKITYAREVKATLLASKRASLPLFQNAEDALDRAISERNCKRVIQAVEGLRRAAGVPTSD